jgi:ketosteroid isomerase-like protein
MGFIPAYEPEDCDRLLLEALEKGDSETATGLYEPGAVLFTESGGLIKGRDEIRKQNEVEISLEPKFTIDEIRTTVGGDGTLATTRMRCTSVRRDPRSGNRASQLVNTLEVVRRQLDGTWRFVIDDPFGGSRASMKG